MNTLLTTAAALLHSARYGFPANLLLAAWMLWQDNLAAVMAVITLIYITLLQIRLAFDARILASWARADGTPEDFDRDMRVLGFSLPAARSLETRCQGAVRLYRRWAWASGVQALLAVLSAIRFG